MNLYFVIAEDGTQYEPADLDLLVKWAREGRIGPDTAIIDEPTGVITPAGELPELGLSGLFFGRKTFGSGRADRPANPKPPASPSRPEAPSGSGQARPGAPILSQTDRASSQRHGQNETPRYPSYRGPSYPSTGNLGGAFGGWSTEVALAFVFGTLGMACCLGSPIVGLILAVNAAQKGNPVRRSPWASASPPSCWF